MASGVADHARMFIRRTQTRRAKDGSTYITHRLVRSERRAGKVRQRTLLNLGRHFEIERESWPRLCGRVEDLLDGRSGLFDDVPAPVETEAQRIAALLLARGAAGASGEASDGPADSVAIHPDSMALARPRSVGVEQVGLWALEQVGLMPLLEELGVNGALRAAAAGLIVGRLAHPGSERETHRWLARDSGLGELLGVDYEAMGAMRLYRASDALVKHREAIEARLYDRAMDLFGLSATVTLFDLTNTYFEGDADKQPLARRGHSKEKRSDRPLVTLGLVLDGSGFVRRSRVFAGNVREHTTLRGMLEGLGAPADALVVMDRGIAAEAQIAWLRESGYRYLVVGRQRKREFDAEAAESVTTASGHTLHLDRRVCGDTGEVRLNCHSEERAEKERAMVGRLCERYEAALTKLSDGLSKPRARRKPEQINERVGRLKAKHAPRVRILQARTGRRGGPRHGRDVDARPRQGFHGRPARRVQPAHQPHGLGRRTAVENLCHPDGLGSRVPLPQVRTRTAAHTPPRAQAHRRTPVHHRRRLSTRADRSPAPARERPHRELDRPAQPPRPAMPRHRHLPLRRRAHPAPAEGHRPGTAPTAHLRRPRHRPRGRRLHQKTDLNRGESPKKHECSALRGKMSPVRC